MTLRLHIKKGLDLPIVGVPEQTIVDAPPVRTVALVGDDYVGLKPTMLVGEGDRVELGQLLLADKKIEGVQYASPGSGRVVAINRGAKRKFESMVIELDGDQETTFEAYPDHNLAQLDRRQVRDNLVASGLWTSLRTRPYSKVPDTTSMPQALFVTAIDTNPLAVDPAIVLNVREREFVAGLGALSTLTEGKTYLCKARGASIPGTDLGCVEVAEFSGPHPAGLPGTHIHFLTPVSDTRTVWHINYQDVVAVGHLFLTGRLSVERVISIAGPAAARPRVVRTRIGANLTELTDGEAVEEQDAPVRIVSGSVLAGRKSAPPRDFLGRYHLQVTLLREGYERRLLGWMTPGGDRFSVKRAFASALAVNGDRRFAMTTTTSGSRRAIVPIGVYEGVMPLDIIATPLLKALITHDTEYAQALGCLELDEEDLALCTFVCPGKYEYGPLLRENLQTIELEG